MLWVLFDVALAAFSGLLSGSFSCGVGIIWNLVG